MEAASLRAPASMILNKNVERAVLIPATNFALFTTKSERRKTSAATKKSFALCETAADRPPFVGGLSLPHLASATA